MVGEYCSFELLRDKLCNVWQLPFLGDGLSCFLLRSPTHRTVAFHSKPRERLDVISSNYLVLAGKLSVARVLPFAGQRGKSLNYHSIRYILFL